MGKEMAIEKVIECLQEMNLPVKDPPFGNPDYSVATNFQYKNLNVLYVISFVPERSMFALQIYFPAKISKEERDAIYGVINLFNSKSLLGHFAICELANKVIFRFGYFLVDGIFDKERFMTNFHKLLYDAHESYPLLQKMISEDGANT